MSNLTEAQVDTVVQKCLDLFNKLPKIGKPIEKEWTVLSCVVKYDCNADDFEVVSLGTGSKCIGASKLSPVGDLLNDSHAEVFARRGFLVYLYGQLKKDSTIFDFKDGKFVLKENVQFIFYSSQLPCGDASIIPKVTDEDSFGEVLQTKKRKADDDICDTESKKFKSGTQDIHRTGAKCLPGAEQDPKEDGEKYHLLGQVRIKPGRGDRTLSVSCSDKIARWIHVGIHGGLLDMLLEEPIYIEHIIFGAGVPYSEETLKRAFLQRNGEYPDIKVVPKLYQSSVVYPRRRRTTEYIKPAPGSILWVKVKDQLIEVAVQGRKLGLTKKKLVSPKNFLCISKYKLYEQFLQILKENDEIKSLLFGDDSIEGIPYNEMKSKSLRYLENWQKVKNQFFKTWTSKPDIWNFCIEN